MCKIMLTKIVYVFAKSFSLFTTNFYVEANGKQQNVHNGIRKETLMAIKAWKTLRDINWYGIGKSIVYCLCLCVRE